MKFYWILSLFVIVLCLDFVFSQECQGWKKCGECLRIPGCVWCQDPKFTLDKSDYNRCGTEASHRNKCNDLVRLEAPSSTEIPNSDRTPLIEPKSYTVKLGVDQTRRIEIKYNDPGNKPLDLYYLMDLSATMEDDKEAVIKLGQELAGALKLTTTDLQMGFGSFIDKPMMPYATLSQINMKETDKYTQPYGFKNHLNLTMDHNSFRKAVNAAKISANLDAPEGGLDAIMQAIVCKDQIGWREKARRILVMSTDGNFHIAGDGRLGGIVTPNDGKCHLENNTYTHSKILDYPSISQIISKVQEEKIFVIFAVVEQERALYEEFARHLHPFASTIILNDKSADVDKLVKDQYEKIRATVELIIQVNNAIQQTMKPFQFLDLDFSTRCTPSGPITPGYKCEGVTANQKLQFFVDIKLKACPLKEDQWRPHFDISTGSTESLRVNLDLNCGCKCEAQVKRGNRECTNQGEIQCGVCACLPGYLGDYCQCQTNGTSPGSPADVSKCIKLGSSICSDRGTCPCNQCVCQKDYHGEFCECNRRKCPNRNGLECSGNGVCACEECKCDAGFTGSGCECVDSQENCKRTGDDKLCSGAGQCQCNQCICHASTIRGKYCHVCMHSGCECLPEVFEYVRCSMMETPNATHIQNVPDSTKCLEKSLPPGAINVEFLEIRYSELYDNDTYQFIAGVDKECKLPFPTRKRNDCNLHFVYSYRGGLEKVYIGVRSELVCPIIKGPVSPLPIILGTIGSILLIGMLTLLLWKIITYFHDKREYTRFEQERKGAKWDSSGNPLYKGATSTFQNPGFTG